MLLFCCCCCFYYHYYVTLLNMQNSRHFYTLLVDTTRHCSRWPHLLLLWLSNLALIISNEPGICWLLARWLSWLNWLNLFDWMCRFGCVVAGQLFEGGYTIFVLPIFCHIDRYVLHECLCTKCKMLTLCWMQSPEIFQLFSLIGFSLIVRLFDCAIAIN